MLCGCLLSLLFDLRLHILVHLRKLGLGDGSISITIHISKELIDGFPVGDVRPLFADGVNLSSNASNSMLAFSGSTHATGSLLRSLADAPTWRGPPNCATARPCGALWGTLWLRAVWCARHLAEPRREPTRMKILNQTRPIIQIVTIQLTSCHVAGSCHVPYMCHDDSKSAPK